MAKITKFENLECWKHARKLSTQVYNITQRNNFKRDISLARQIQSASVSIMANIAEGFSRRSNNEFIQFLFFAISSAAEVQSHLYIALDQEY
ncbi:MAG: four helix bundle protein [Candidatus Aminicenantes bacterium]|nr:four helix bundle protein [Candidatus Aminicenantes bacterium]